MSEGIDIDDLVVAHGKALAAIFSGWRKNPPSTLSLVEAAAAHFKIPAGEKYLTDAFNTAAAADVPVNNPYHDNHHFREVTATMISLVHAHNSHFEPKLDARDICKCLIAAAAHDLAHTGKPNTRAFEREDAAIEALAGVVHLDAGDFEDIKTMLRLTDISPHADSAAAGVPLGNEKLRVMAAMLQDADIVPSTATTYAYNKKMSTLLSREIPAVRPTAQNLLAFMAHAIGKDYKSPAAQKIYGPSMRSVREYAQKRLRAP